ncbi:MAG: outer membrane beta-barrel protein [Bacteroidota bacterium]|nr:outer membrane beta-barrel protein [Bacteroidota bacterium]
MRLKKISLNIAFLIFIGSAVTAQNIRATVGLGPSAYLGDLISGSPLFKESSVSLNLGGTYDLTQQFRARLNLSLLGVKGDDAKSSRPDFQARALNFKSFVWELAAMGEYDFLDRDVYNIVPYAFGGLGLFHFNPTTIDANGNKVHLHDIGTEGQTLPDSVRAKYGFEAPYKRLCVNIPLGLGLRYEVSETVSVGFEFCYRILFTDHLDDVSRSQYVDPNLFYQYLPAATAAQAASLSYRASPTADYNYGRARGNPGSKDSYYTFQVSVAFRLDNLGIGGGPYEGYRRPRRYY